MTKMHAWIATLINGSERRYLLDTEQAPNAEAALRLLRDTWGQPIVAMRNQLTPAETAQFGDEVASMLQAMKE